MGSNPIRGNMFFFQNLFHIYMYLQDVFLCIYLYIYKEMALESRDSAIDG